MYLAAYQQDGEDKIGRMKFTHSGCLNNTGCSGGGDTSLEKRR